jgi:hypothetical protein
VDAVVVGQVKAVLVLRDHKDLVEEMDVLSLRLVAEVVAWGLQVEHQTAEMVYSTTLLDQISTTQAADREEEVHLHLDRAVVEEITRLVQMDSAVAAAVETQEGLEEMVL